MSRDLGTEGNPPFDGRIDRLAIVRSQVDQDPGEVVRQPAPAGCKRRAIEVGVEPLGDGWKGDVVRCPRGPLSGGFLDLGSQRPEKPRGTGHVGQNDVDLVTREVNPRMAIAATPGRAGS